MAVDKRGFGRVLRFPGTGSADSDHAGYFAVDDPLATEAREPVDMAQVRADDAFIESLAHAADANRPVDADPLDERMASLLLSWRDEVGSKPARPVIDLDTAMAAIRNAPRAPAGRQLFGPLAAAAAVLVIAFTGIGLAARDAVPGTPLFGVTKVLYSDKARSVEAAAAVRTQLEYAKQALSSGRVEEAEAAIVQAQERLPGVAAEDGKGDLAAQTEQLTAQLDQRRGPDTVPLTPISEPPPAQQTPSVSMPPQSTAPTTQPSLPTTTNPLPPPPVSTTETPAPSPSASAEGTPSLQAPGGKSGESVSGEPNGTSSQGSGS